MYMIPMMILWTFQVSPFPSTSTMYPKGITVSFLFSLAILSFPFIEFLARKFSNYIKIMFVPLLFCLTFSPFLIDNGSWLIGDVSNFMITEMNEFSLITLFLSFGSDMYEVMWTFIIFYVVVVGYMFVDIYGDEAIKYKHKSLIANSLVFIRILFFPIFAGLFINLLQMTPLTKAMNPLLTYIEVAFYYILVIGATVASHISLLKSKSIKWTRYLSKGFQLKWISFIIIIVVAFLVLLPSTLKKLSNEYMYVDTSYEVQPFEDAVYDSRIAPLRIDNNFVIAMNSDGYSKLAVVDLDHQDVVSELEQEMLIESIYSARQYILVVYDELVKIYNTDLIEMTYQQNDNLYIVGNIGIILNKDLKNISVINQSDLAFYNSNVLDIFNNCVLSYHDHRFYIEVDEEIQELPAETKAYYSLNDEYGMLLSNSESVGMTLVNKKNGELNVLILDDVNEDQLFGGDLDEFYYTFDGNQLCFYYRWINKDEFIVVYSLDTLEEEVIRGTLPIINNKDYQKYLKYSDDVVILYDKLSTTIYDVTHNRIIDTLYVDVSEGVREAYRNSSYSEIGQYLSHTGAVFTGRYLYNDSIYWVDTAGTIHMYSLTE